MRSSIHPSSSHIILGSGSRVGSESGERELVSFPVRDLMHVWCAGKSGYGKSRLLASLFVMLLSRGIGCTLIDPAGDLSRLILTQLISLGYFDQREDPFGKLLYLDLPAALRKEKYLPFNVLRTGHDPYTTADLVLEAFKRAWPSLKSGTSVNIEALVKVSSFVLASNGLPLFPHMYYLLTDANFRQQQLRSITDPLILQFFQQHTNQKTGQLDLGVDPTLKRLFLIAFAPLLRHSLGQSENILDFRKLIATNTSVLLNLNLPDPEAMRLLGCLVTVAAEMGAKARGEIPAEQRRGVHVLLIDEFANFTAQSAEAMEHMLAECRKYSLFLGLFHQGFSQLSREIRGALHNCDLRMVFRLERPDAEEAAPLLGFPIDPTLVKLTATGRPSYASVAEQKEQHIQALTQLSKREAVVKLPGDKLYTVRSLTVDDPVVDAARRAAVEQEYIRRYFRSAPSVREVEPVSLDRSPVVIHPPLVQQREALGVT